MHWTLSHRADPLARVIADRHYNRQKPGTPQFVPPGRCMVLRTPAAFWVTSWPFAEYVKHAWAGAMVCSAFRNESDTLSSELIWDALKCTRFKWPDLPELGMITFVDTKKTKPKAHPGYCYRVVGFEHVGYTKAGLVALQLTPDKWPASFPPRPNKETHI